MANSKRRCPSCKKHNKVEDGLLIYNSLYCDIECAVSNAKKNAQKGKKIIDKEDRKELKEKKLKLKSISEWKRDAQTWFNRYIRIRDDLLPCISCGRHHKGQYHAGHYLTTGANPELRYEEDNCHKQCAPCNNHLSGNIVNYRHRLISKIGLDNVEWLEGPHKQKKYTVDDLKEIISMYKEKCKELA